MTTVDQQILYCVGQNLVRGQFSFWRKTSAINVLIELIVSMGVLYSRGWFKSLQLI
jgi:hypothetical protein